MFCAVLSMELYTIVPDTPKYRLWEERRYPYNGTKVTVQAYVDYLGVRIGFTIMAFCLFLATKKYRFQVLLCVIILLGYIIDYIMSYNMAGGIHSYAMFMVMVFGAIIIKTIIDDE